MVGIEEHPHRGINDAEPEKGRVFLVIGDQFWFIVSPDCTNLHHSRTSRSSGICGPRSGWRSVFPSERRVIPPGFGPDVCRIVKPAFLGETMPYSLSACVLIRFLDQCR